jgi:serine/threonine-protein kinase RsbW
MIRVADQDTSELRRAPTIAPSTGEDTAATPVIWWSREFPGIPTQVRAARQWIQDLLPDCLPLDDLVFVADELVTNAIEHTRSGGPGGWFCLDIVWFAEEVWVVVTDQGSDSVPAITTKKDDENSKEEDGRGLWVVDAMSSDWGMAGNASGRWVYAAVAWGTSGGPPPTPPDGDTEALADIAVGGTAFPGISIWFGRRTRKWWAALPGTIDENGLISASSQDELTQILVAVYPDFCLIEAFTGRRHLPSVPAGASVADVDIVGLAGC